MCQCLNVAWKCAKRRANFSTRRANVPNGVPIFRTFLLRNALGNFYTLLLYQKLYIMLDIIVIHIICIHKNCIILHFYTSCHIKEKYVECFVYVTSNNVFFEFSTPKTTKQKKNYVWILWSSWIVICLSWRSEIVVRSLIVTVSFRFLWLISSLNKIYSVHDRTFT